MMNNDNTPKNSASVPPNENASPEDFFSHVRGSWGTIKDALFSGFGLVFNLAIISLAAGFTIYTVNNLVMTFLYEKWDVRLAILGEYYVLAMLWLMSAVLALSVRSKGLMLFTAFGLILSSMFILA